MQLHLPSCRPLGVISGRTGGDVAQFAERKTSTPLRQVRFPVAARDFSPSQISVQTLLRCPCSPCVQSHPLISVCTLKIPTTGSHTFVWTHENAARTVTERVDKRWGQSLWLERAHLFHSSRALSSFALCS